jgi:predicted 2-oxoglutarate/Fe(II)-dependent dioxygenase YbiX
VHTCAVADPAAPAARAAIAALTAAPQLSEAERLSILFIAAESAAEITEAAGRKLVFTDANAARACRLIAPGAEGRWILLDPTLRAMAFWPLTESAAALAALAATPAPDTTLNAPILVAPRVFEPEFCKALIAHYAERGGEPSGVTVQNAAGVASVQLSPSFKRRFDCIIEDENLKRAIMNRIYWRLAPEIERAFMWRATRMERYLIACYDAAGGGYFRPHRDNTTNATIHRRFAVTINLNAEDYEGGDLRFPEFGPKSYRAPTGGAVVFSCALMHEALPVTRGKRYAFLPFLYDDAAAAIRSANNSFVDNETIKPYGEA